MKAHEGIIAGASTLITYLACPDILNKWETVLFLITVFGCAVCVIWGVEELQARIRRARRIARRKRKVVDIDFHKSGLVEEGTGREVEVIG